MAKNNLVVSGFRLILTLFLLVMIGISVTTGQAAPPPVPACNPFNADGTVKSTRDCECSQLKTDANYCLDPTEYLQLKVSQNVGAALLSGVEKFAGLLWFLDRLAVNFAQFALSGTVWTQIREALLEMLANILGGSGGVLDLIIRGPNGLFYLALIFAGLVMILPFAILGQRPIKIERVFLWGVFIIALFIGSTQGFDLIGAIEQLRVNLMQTVLSGETVDLSALVGAPMRATSTEATLIEEGQPLALPAAFADAYFPGVESLDTWRFRVRVPTPLNNILDVVFPGVLYQDEALKEASNQAMGGVLLALLSLLPAAILFLTGAVLMLLTAASLVLIIFFVAAIPLGFFEFGAMILGVIARQYLGITQLSLFTAVFIRILAGLGVGIFGNDFSLSGMVIYLGGLGLVAVALQAALRQAWKALDGSAGMIQNAFTPVFASAGNLPYTSGPVSGAMETGQSTLNSAVQTASMLAMGAATGGGSLLAAIPGLLAGDAGGNRPQGGTSQPGSDLQALASAFPNAANSNIASPASTSPVAIPSVQPSAGGTSIPTVPTAPGNIPTPHAHDRQPPVTPPGTRPFTPAHDPTYITPDVQGLKDAEHAYFEAGDHVASRRLLAQSLGSNALADALLEVYRTEERVGAEKARQVIEQAQDTATGQLTTPVVNGTFTPAYLTAFQDAMRQAGLTDTPMYEELTQASVRRVTKVDELPEDEQAELLTYAVVAPDDPLLLVEDAAAQFRLHDLSEKMGWEADKLKVLFAHYDRALRESKRAGQPVHPILSQRLHTDPAFAQDSDPTRQEAARLAVLVAEKTWIQLPTEAPASPGSAQSATSSASKPPSTPVPSSSRSAPTIATADPISPANEIPAPAPVGPPAASTPLPTTPASVETLIPSSPIPQTGPGHFNAPDKPIPVGEAPPSSPVASPAISTPLPETLLPAESPIQPVLTPQADTDHLYVPGGAPLDEDLPAPEPVTLPMDSESPPADTEHAPLDTSSSNASILEVSQTTSLDGLSSSTPNNPPSETEDPRDGDEMDEANLLWTLLETDLAAPEPSPAPTPQATPTVRSVPFAGASPLPVNPLPVVPNPIPPTRPAPPQPSYQEKSTHE